MQPIDPEDPRRPYVQIAASIRAAILSGELEPGAQLPSAAELSEFFGVARNTVGSAIRTLKQEGFVRGVAGGNVYVTEQASMPVPTGETHQLAGVANFLHEMGHLKNLSRAGWLLLGISSPETVAEHSFRVGITAIALATLEGANIGRTATLALFHDGHETRIGDVPSVGRAYVTTAVPEAVTVHQTSGMPDEIAQVFQDLTAEYEAGKTLESRVAHDADKVETLLQAAEYKTQGYATEPWRDTSIEALRTESAKQLAQAITSGDPRVWWHAFAASYHELRASTRAQQG